MATIAQCDKCLRLFEDLETLTEISIPTVAPDNDKFERKFELCEDCIRQLHDYLKPEVWRPRPTIEKKADSVDVSWPGFNDNAADILGIIVYEPVKEYANVADILPPEDGIPMGLGEKIADVTISPEGRFTISEPSSTVPPDATSTVPDDPTF